MNLHASSLPTTKIYKQDSQVRNKQSRNLKRLTKCLRETAYAASPTLSHDICLRRTYAPSRIAYAGMI